MKIVVPFPCDSIPPPVVKIPPAVQEIKKPKVKHKKKIKQPVQNVRTVSYKVKKGDTYYSISKKLNVPLSKMNTNTPLKEGNTIKIVMD